MQSLSCFHKKFSNYLYKDAKDCVKVKPDSSIPYVMASMRVVNTLYMISDKDEVLIPKAVLYRASEIPNARLLAAPPPPSSERAANERIIPITVPSRAIRVPSDTMVDKNTRFFCSIGSSRAVASSTSCWME